MPKPCKKSESLRATDGEREGLVSMQIEERSIVVRLGGYGAQKRRT